MKLISIITPVYNSELFISETINSVLAQSYANFEHIIIDDCSDDNSVKIIQSYIAKDSRIKLLSLKTNSGAAVARNLGLKHAKGSYICFLDSDDIWFPSKLEKQLEFMSRLNAPISFTSYNLVDQSGINYDKVIKAVDKLHYHDYLKNTIIGMSTSMINKNLVSDFEFINIRTRQDTYLWISLLKKGYVAYGLNEVLVSYRVRSNSISANKFKAMRQVWYLYYKLEKLGFFRSSYFFLFYLINAIKKRF